MTAAVDIVRRFMPKGADHRTALCAAIRLMGQCNVFVRNRELLAGPFRGVSTDTRTLTPGDLFVALRGPNFDGHRFIAEAVRRGAAAVLVEEAEAANLPQVPAVVVENSTAALDSFARELSAMHGPDAESNPELDLECDVEPADEVAS